VAEPAALGLFAFATGTFTQNIVNAGWFPATTLLYMVAPLLIMTGVVQFLAGMWAFRKGDTFAATAFGSFGGVNVAYTVFILLHQAGLVTGPSADMGVIGAFLASFALIAAFLTVGALWKNWGLVGMLFFLTLTFALLGAGNIAGSPNLLHYGGWAGIISSLCAFYRGGAMAANSASQRQLLPLGKPLDSAPTPAALPASVPSDGHRGEALG